MDRSFTLKQLAVILVLSVAVVAATLIWLRPQRRQMGDARLDAIFALAKDQTSLARLGSADLILINFWASWCAPCLQETPSLIRFANSHKPRLAFVSISQDTASKELAAFLKVIPLLEASADLFLRDQDQSLGRLFGVASLPDTFIYSPSRHRVFRMSGSYDWDRPDTMAQIEKEFASR